MSPIDGDMPGIKGKRLPGRPGRFDPSEPLHMTTRRAAKKPTVNGSPSTNGSVGDDESRRGSFDNLRPVTSHSNGSQVSVKSQRLSEISGTHATPNNHMNGTSSSEERRNGRSVSKRFSPVQQTPSPSRKRKRSSSTPPRPPTLQEPNSIGEDGFNDDDESPRYEDDFDVDVVHPDSLSDREAAPSEASSRSEEIAEGIETMIAMSMDVTPAVSEPVSPATSESNSQDRLSLAKTLESALEEVAQAARAEQEDQDDQDDAVDIAEDIDDVDEIDDQARSDDDTRPRRGRFGGRRRAKHPNAEVEKAMQRQAELKSAYRAIARAQKAVLAEIAQRTIDDLETNPEAHTGALEYEGVRSRIDDAYEERQSHLRAQHELNTKQLEQTLKAEQQTLNVMCQRRLQELNEAYFDQLEYEMVRITREAHARGIEAQYETEDEDDVIPRPKGMGYRWKRTAALGKQYDSRSRVLATGRATAGLEARFEVQKLLQDLNEEDKPEELKGFTSMDPALRELAVERREGISNAKTLAEAAAEIERIAKIPVIRNEEAYGLQLLGDLASRPSIGNSAPPPSRSKASRGSSIVGRTPPRPMPPHLQLQTNYGRSSIPVEMSPRTTQALGDRFEASMPPPMTPRQTATPFLRSPEAARSEFSAPSPTTHTPRLNSSHQPEEKLFEGRPQSRSAPFPKYNNAPQEPPQRSHERRLDNRIAPFVVEERRSDLPGWRGLASTQPLVPPRRLSANADRPSFSFAEVQHQRDERTDNLNRRREEIQRQHDSVKSELSPYNVLNRKASQWMDMPSQPGASNALRYNNAMSPSSESQRQAVEMPRSSHLKNSSATFSVHDYRPDDPNRPRSKSMKGVFQQKTSKAERGGVSRRHWTSDPKKHTVKLFDKSRPGGSPTTASSSFAGSPVERAPAPSPWQGAPLQNSPLGPPPPTATFQPTSPYGHPLYAPSQQSHEYYQHRNSFPPQPPASIWNQPSQSNLYAVPQPQHPSPPGVPPEQYSRFAPPPPPGYQHQPPPPPPQTPQSAPGSYGQQFGGPPIAPATPGFHPLGYRPAPPPAFAQQAQQQQSNFGHRRRAQSDAGNLNTKFHAWNPTGSRR